MKTINHETATNKSWNPDKSSYQQTIVNKYKLKGFSNYMANKLAREEYYKSVRPFYGYWKV